MIVMQNKCQNGIAIMLTQVVCFLYYRFLNSFSFLDAFTFENA